MTSNIIGPCHTHLLDQQKLFDSHGTPLLEFITTEGNSDLEQERAAYIRECINQCLSYGLPVEIIEKLNTQHEKKQKSVVRGFNALMTILRKLKRSPDASADTMLLVNNGIRAGKKSLKRLSPSH